jgi:hypothetical protein
MKMAVLWVVALCKVVLLCAMEALGRGKEL